MKLYRRDAFMALPEGTIYTKGEPWVFGVIEVKGETIAWDGRNIDWYCHALNGIETQDAPGSEYDDMLENGTSYPLQVTECRDGMFDDRDLFLVFEADDLDELQRLIDAARAAIPPAA